MPPLFQEHYDHIEFDVAVLNHTYLSLADSAFGMCFTERLTRTMRILEISLRARDGAGGGGAGANCSTNFCGGL